MKNFEFIIVISIIMIGVVDRAIGHPLFYRLMDLFYLDGYPTLWAKYHDNSCLTVAQHKFVADNKDKFKAYLRNQHQFKLCRKYCKSWRYNDWESMLEMMLEVWQIESI